MKTKINQGENSKLPSIFVRSNYTPPMPNLKTGCRHDETADWLMAEAKGLRKKRVDRKRLLELKARMLFSIRELDREIQKILEK